MQVFDCKHPLRTAQIFLDYVIVHDNGIPTGNICFEKIFLTNDFGIPAVGFSELGDLENDELSRLSIENNAYVYTFQESDNKCAQTGKTIVPHVLLGNSAH